MPFLRFACHGRINKPLPSAFLDALPAIQDSVATLKTYAQKINEGLPNEEATDTVLWGNEIDHIWFSILLATPMPIPQALQDKLPAIRTQMRKLKTYAINTGEAVFHGGYHICHHGESYPIPCELEKEI